MSQVVREYYPNPRNAKVAPASTSWVVVASDGSTYSTMALLIAAGKRPYPGLDHGGRIGTCLLHAVTSSGGAGSPIYYALDEPTTPTEENVLGGSDQQVSIAGPFRNLWLKLTNASDIVMVNGRY